MSKPCVLTLQHPLPTHPVFVHRISVQDLLLPESGEGFTTLRCPLRDIVEEDISEHFPAAIRFISAALSEGSGGVLVHCHGGRSRSVSLVSDGGRGREGAALGGDIICLWLVVHPC